ncbi:MULTISPECIES: dihydrofolate reductase family protein [Roseomonadaceae]|uniref:Dihydrofolate reductase family protein n=1 Tax=Falsiroseomonas oleicola TaxID=2801474 RepID=A0ABS6H0I3_9PROT|nr:dihydrofolate reductase family protein [Roseomonas oleicola]MBU8542177.1 dihydrofolate reductase family protein [Roseomonas oleicola]
MRQLIAGMKISLDGRTEGPDRLADWVEAWSEDYGLTPRIDACILGGGMYPGYVAYWTSIQVDPSQPTLATGRPPSPGELAWAKAIGGLPHHVLTRELPEERLPGTQRLDGLAAVAALKRQAGRDIYLVGGGRTTASLIQAGLVDELRLLVYPLIAGPGTPLFDDTTQRRGLTLRQAEPRPDGRVLLVYGAG